MAGKDGQGRAQGRATFEQQKRIIEKKEVTSAGDPAMPILEGLDDQPARRVNIPPIGSDDRSIPRGTQQESQHNKPRADES
jgi:hypothetical protein